MVAPPLVKAGVLCRGVLLLGCRGAGGGRGGAGPSSQARRVLQQRLSGMPLARCESCRIADSLSDPQSAYALLEI